VRSWTMYKDKTYFLLKISTLTETKNIFAPRGVGERCGFSAPPLTRTDDMDDMSACTRRRNGAACSWRGVFRIASAGRVLVTRFTLAFPDRLRPNNRKKRRNMKLRGEVVVRGRPRKSFFFAAGCRPAVVRADRFRSWLHSRLHT